MIESAQSMLAGLFPPQQHEIWEPNGLNWQPIGNGPIISSNCDSKIYRMNIFFSRAYNTIRSGVFIISTKAM